MKEGERQQAFAAERSRRPGPSRWPEEATAADAKRWVLEAPALALPSEHVKSYQAMLAQQSCPDWKTKCSKSDQSNLTNKRKLALLSAAHQDLSHMGGRDALVAALRDVDHCWVNLKLDAQWFVDRCEDWGWGLRFGQAAPSQILMFEKISAQECRVSSCRDLAKPCPRHLPTPGQAGDCVLGGASKRWFPPAARSG